MTLAALEQAAQRGYRLATLISTEMGYGLYRRLGFTPVGQSTRYVRAAE